MHAKNRAHFENSGHSLSHALFRFRSEPLCVVYFEAFCLQKQRPSGNPPLQFAFLERKVATEISGNLNYNGGRIAIFLRFLSGFANRLCT